MQIKTFKTRVFKEREDLIKFILDYVKKIPEKSVLVITSKIVALSEGRTKVIKDQKEKIEIIKQESDFMFRTKYTWLTIKDGMVMASAGVDESNAKGKLILLPKDSFKSAEYIRKELKKHFKIKNLGILITDSRIFPLRAGIVGVALGYSGFKGVRDYRGKKDIFGRILKFSRTDVADSLATAAVLPMGEGDERQPIALVTDSNVEFRDKVDKKELKINIKEDLYMPFFQGFLRKNN
ncbi:MAG: coenzyme F420-0:L-glutamate ligase [Candidatus Pacebacteria bacterium]|nr:coenzyme F420-0:L-glutamate ligase [Candidatus Paceibacterota bacterium]MBP9839515.1 coenzyme F420-0:L-glutamate ligase [Candidatus Paceibacterota bacterium]